MDKNLCGKLHVCWKNIQMPFDFIYFVNKKLKQLDSDDTNLTWSSVDNN